MNPEQPAALAGNGGAGLATLFFAAAQLSLLVGIFEDSYRLAFHDQLTGLPGRRALDEAMRNIVAAGGDTGEMSAKGGLCRNDFQDGPCVTVGTQSRAGQHIDFPVSVLSHALDKEPERLGGRADQEFLDVACIEVRDQESAVGSAEGP